MKLFELMLYIALLAFMFSGYIVFASNTSQYIGQSLIHRKVLIVDSLIHEYLRWSMYQDIAHSESELQSRVSTSTIITALKRISGDDSIFMNYVSNIIPDERVVHFAVTYASSSNGVYDTNREREYTILMP